MDETPDATLPPPVLVRRPTTRRASSLVWSLPLTTIVVLGLAGLTGLVLAVDGLAYGGLAVLAPLADSAPTAPDPARYGEVLVAAALSGPLAAFVGSVVWDRRAPTTPAAVRGLAVGAAASALAAAVVAFGLGLV